MVLCCFSVGVLEPVMSAGRLQGHTHARTSRHAAPGMITKTFGLCLGIFMAVQLVRPAQAADFDNLLTGYSLTSWNNADGRSLGAVYAIVQDRDGYLWIGSDSGLLRFDGSRFVTLEVISSASLPKAAVMALCVSRDGSLWVGFADGIGVGQIRDGQVHIQDQGLENLGSVTDLVEDHDGMIWAVGDGALFELLDGHWQKANVEWMGGEARVRQAYVRSNGELWVGTWQGVFRRSHGGDTFQRISAGVVWGLSEDVTGLMWTTDIATGFRPLGVQTPPQTALEGAGHRLMYDRKGNLWIATFGAGLWRFSGKAKTSIVEKASRLTGLYSDLVQSLIEDRDGNIWVGTNGGLHRLTERTLRPVDGVGFAVAVEPSQDGRIWLGRTNGVIELSAAGREWQQATASSPGPFRSLYRAPDGTLWVGAIDGLFRLVDRHLVQVALPQRVRPQITSISPDGHGGLWLGDGNWLYRWDGSRLVPFDASLEPSTPKKITFACADRSGRLWIGFSGGHLGFQDFDGNYRSLGPREGLGVDALRAIHSVFEAEDGTVWIGSSSGLSWFVNGRIATVTHENGLPGDSVWAVIDDLSGNLWLSFARGLVRLDKTEIVKATHIPSHRIRYRLYDTFDGLAGAATGIIDSTRASDGTLWFVRGGGLTLVNPRDLAADSEFAPGPVRVETALVNGRRFTPVSPGLFPPDTKRLQINYSALTLTTPDKLRFRYRLDGVDPNWIDAETRRLAFYTNLSPGSYRFHVEALTDDGTWNSSTATWDFAIQRAFYQTLWFSTICIAAVVLCLWGLWRFRLELVRRQFTLVLAERVRLSREIHDTLLQGLVGVMLQFDAIAKDLGPSSSSARTQLIRVRKHVEAYIREARRSIVNLRSPLFETHNLVSALTEFGQNAVADTSMRFASRTVGVACQCSPELETQLLRIGQEAITNAVRHSQAQFIHLELKFDQRSVTLRVSDDGRGFDYECLVRQASSHYGLTTMKERAGQLGGEFRIVSAIGDGTSVEAVFPMLIGA
jgi:signal transduction histidine kinase/ligand-binding sensor domain-containing protein